MDAPRFLPIRWVFAVMATLGIARSSFAEEPFWNRGIPSPPSNNLPSVAMRSAKLPTPVALDTLPKAWQETLGKVMQQPTISASASPEEFPASPEMYAWLLEHPDRTSLAWKRLKIAAIDIRPLDGGRFVWYDEHGSEMIWRTVAKTPEGRIWYAEGKVRPAALCPTIPVRAVAVLRHRGFADAAGDTTIRHQVEVFIHTDSPAANVVLRMLGPSAPKMAEQGAEQLLMFFSGIAKYVDRYPSKAEQLLMEEKEKPKR